jgi:hypothetical protein
MLFNLSEEKIKILKERGLIVEQKEAIISNPELLDKFGDDNFPILQTEEEGIRRKYLLKDEKNFKFLGDKEISEKFGKDLQSISKHKRFYYNSLKKILKRCNIMFFEGEKYFQVFVVEEDFKEKFDLAKNRSSMLETVPITPTNQEIEESKNFFDLEIEEVRNMMEVCGSIQNALNYKFNESLRISLVYYSAKKGKTRGRKTLDGSLFFEIGKRNTGGNFYNRKVKLSTKEEDLLYNIQLSLVMAYKYCLELAHRKEKKKEE